MIKNQAAAFFDKKRAETYDKQRVKMAPVKDALHFFMKAILADLPSNAHVLCVGVGTGAELFELAEANPDWRFTAVEPAADMLDICKKKAEEKGLSDRCEFHEGYVDTLQTATAFDAATSILVAHFITSGDERVSFYKAIANYLKAGGYFINADLSADTESVRFGALFDAWLTMASTSGMSEAELKSYRESIGKTVSMVPGHEVEAMLSEAGLIEPIEFYQALLIRAWFSRKT